MNILIAGDLHFNKTQLQWFSDQKEYYYCLCLTGDLLDGNSYDFTQQSEWVSKWLKELDKYLAIRVISPRYILCGHVENPSANRDCIFGVEIVNPGAQHNALVPNHKIIKIVKKGDEHGLEGST